ncbi:MAG: hypothetical protein ACI9OO_000828 [Bacteroidia bacterium]|jgi:hypothetical protein
MHRFLKFSLQGLCFGVCIDFFWLRSPKNCFVRATATADELAKVRDAFDEGFRSNPQGWLK